jgi:hypothetical protein
MADGIRNADVWPERRIHFLSATELVAHDDGDGLEFITYPDSTAAQFRTGLLAKYKVESWDDGGLLSIMALANAALPDGHPNKITREDAALLDRFTSETSDGGEPERFYVCTWVPAEEMSRLARLAAKLSALLPPEDAR